MPRHHNDHAFIVRSPAGTSAFPPALLQAVLHLMLVIVALALSMALPSLARAQTPETIPLLFEVRMEQHVVAEALTAYRIDDDIYFPLGELAQLLGIGIQTEPRLGIAHGFIIQENRRFSLDVKNQSFQLGSQSGSFDVQSVLLQDDDIYVAVSLLKSWLPVRMDVDLSKLQFQLLPLETLPLQARMQRERRAAHLERESQPPSGTYPDHDLSYRLFDVPFIDQTFSVKTRHGNAANDGDNEYTVSATGDLLGMEASLYLSQRSGSPSPQPRLTLSRHDPDGQLLGALQARSVELGSITLPGITHVSRAGAPGYGVLVSNRPLTHPENFNRHTVQGNLPPGWDVELYFNNALIGLQRANAEGRYRFDDLPLIFGANEFRLVFHGPLGQVRMERQRILLEPSIVRPGEFFYSAAEQQSENGERRSALQFDAGFSDNLIGTGGLSSIPHGDGERHYANLGLKRFWKSFIFSGDFAASSEGGRLAELGVRTRIADMGVQLSRAQLDNYVSEVFAFASDPIQSRDLLRVNGSLPYLPQLSIALEARHDRRQSGNTARDASLRLSASLLETSVSHTLRYFKTTGMSGTEGVLQVSRRVADIGFTGQLGYRAQPEPEWTAAQLTADKPLGQGYRLNLGIARQYPARDLQYSLGLTKSVGRYGLRVNASHRRNGDTALGMQVFVALGREPRQGLWMPDAQPVAHTGSASMQVFLDHNQNGVKDAGDEAISGAGFTIRGSNQPVRSDANGIALLNRLPTRRHIDIALDASTLDDPQWTAQVPGVRLLPRPGRVAEIDIPVIVSTEIEGTVYLEDRSGRRGIGDAVIELVDKQGVVIADTQSAVDGLYVLQGVAPGDYELRLAPSQMQRLQLEASPPQRVTVTRDKAVIGNCDFFVTGRN